MSIAIHCDCCKREIRADMALYVLRLWDLGGFSTYPTVPADGLPFDDEYQLCGKCMERLAELSVKIKAVEQ